MIQKQQDIIKKKVLTFNTLKLILKVITNKEELT